MSDLAIISNLLDGTKRIVPVEFLTPVLMLRIGRLLVRNELDFLLLFVVNGSVLHVDLVFAAALPGYGVWSRALAGANGVAHIARILILCFRLWLWLSWIAVGHIVR